MRKILPFIIVFFFFASIFAAKFNHVFADGTWVADPEVTFVGKSASRADSFLNWTLENYNWICVKQVAANKCDNLNNPLIPFWALIRNIVYALIALFVLATAFILIITRGQNITVMKFIPRFVLILVLVTLSFSLVEFILQAGDVIQGFFLKPGGQIISSKDLLHVDFGYKDFTGYRLLGSQNDESAFITLVLVRLTAITYYVMTGVLLIRKIILWFFIIVSPIFPLLLFYKPIRNTGKIWVGEFFRWLLYGPLFAIFLQGLVVLWRTGIPLPFSQIDQGLPGNAGAIVYPTAVNILLGGPKQIVGINNSVNLSDTFSLYVVALLMLWVVILLPFLLLKIFLDYINTLSFGDNVMLRQMWTRSSSFLGPKPQPPQPPGMTQPTGTARVMPFLTGRAQTITSVSAVNQAMVQESTQVLRQANLSIPRMRDVARFETSMASRDAVRQQEVSRFHQTLKHIANPHAAPVVTDKQRFSSVRDKLVEQKEKGNIVASSVLTASTVASSTLATTVKDRELQKTELKQVLKQVGSGAAPVGEPDVRERLEKVKAQLQEAKAKGDQLATEVLSTGSDLNVPTAQVSDEKVDALVDKLLAEEKKGNLVATAVLSGIPGGAPSVNLPTVNKVQQVSIEEYEEVRKMWLDNYRTIEPPKDLSGKETSRDEWINNDIEKVNQAITLLSSSDQQKVSEGMSMVANILPFLLIGGFSKNEVISYLKAKAEAAKEALTEMKKKEEEEETMVSRSEKKEEQKEMASQEKAFMPEDEKPEEKSPPKPIESITDDPLSHVSNPFGDKEDEKK